MEGPLRMLAAALLCAVVLPAGSAFAQADSNRTTFLLSRAYDGGLPNGVSRNAAVSHGRQSNGSTSEVAVDGDCERVAFVSDATNLALKSTKYLNWKSSVTSSAPAGTRQVYVKVLRATGRDKGFKGLTFLASASRKGRAANGNSWHVSFARAGKALAFASDATNLSRADRNGATDVYERTFNRHYVHIKHHGEQAFQFKTILVSANGSGIVGNGPP